MTLPDGVWIATALLHREQPDRSDFASGEIEARLRREGITGALTSASATISFDSVANKPANPGQTRMLYATDRGRRRLFRSGDEYHPSREGPPERHGTRWMPRREDIPERYHYLLSWYTDGYSPDPTQKDGILSLRGLGRGLWADEHPDDYVRRLRQDW